MEQKRTSKFVSVLLAFVLSFSMLGTASLGLFAGTETAYASDPAGPAKSIYLTQDNNTPATPASQLVLLKGTTKAINATVYDKDGDVVKKNGNPVTATYKSSDTTKASVSETGVITAHELTSAPVTITASYNGVSATCSVEVVDFIFSETGDNPVLLTAGTKSHPYTSKFMWNDGTGNNKPVICTASAQPTDLSGKVSFSVDNTDVLSYSVSTGDCVVTAKAAGTAVVTATVVFKDKSGTVQTKEAKSVVTVTNPPTYQNGKTAIVLDADTPGDSTVLDVNDTHNVVATVLGEFGEGWALNANTKYTWTSSDPDVISVYPAEGSLTATVKALKAGQSTITFVAWSGDIQKKGEITFTVNGIALELNQYVLVKYDAGKASSIWSRMFAEPTVTKYDGNTTPATLTYGNDYTLRSSDDKVAYIDVNNKVINANTTCGVTTIEALDNDGKVIASCEVTVTDPVDGVTINNPKPDKVAAGYEVGEKVEITATLAGTVAQTVTLREAGGSLSWESSDPDVIAIKADEDNAQIATFETLKPGTATIKAIYNSGRTGDTEKEAVYEKPINVNGALIDPSTVTLDARNTTATLNAYDVRQGQQSDPVNAKWSVSEEGVIKLAMGANNAETVTAVGAGTVTVTAEWLSKNNIERSATCEVTVENPATKISVDPTELTLDAGTTGQITATAEGALGPKVTDTIAYTTSDATVATVDNNGVVTAVAEGTATITATAGNVSASCAVTVNAAPTPPTPPTPAIGVTMYRVYNPNSGEHLYTASEYECNYLAGLGWTNEGEAWTAPESGIAVYRLYNPNAGEHHYTTSEVERASLIADGWDDEGIGWYSDVNEGVPVYRVYNPNEYANNHHFTADQNEVKDLVNRGWDDEGIAWYGVK